MIWQNPPAPFSNREHRRDLLFDLVDAHPAGMTIEQMAHDLYCSVQLARIAVHDLRRFLRDAGGDLSLPAIPQGAKQPWLYVLTGQVDEQREWLHFMEMSMRSRLETMHADLVPVIKATDGRKAEGRYVRNTERVLRHLIEDWDAQFGI